MEAKSPLKSKTLWVGAGAFIAGIVALILHYTGSNALGPEALGAAWTDIVTSALMIGLRFATNGPVSFSKAPPEDPCCDDPCDEPCDEPKAGSAATMIVLLSIFALTFASGCKTLTVHAERTIGVDVSQGPPCKISVSADDEVVATVVGPKACKVKDAR